MIVTNILYAMYRNIYNFNVKFHCIHVKFTFNRAFFEIQNLPDLPDHIISTVQSTLSDIVPFTTLL